MSDFDFLSPVKNELLEYANSLHEQCLGSSIAIHCEQQGIPNMEGIKIAVVGVLENRLAENNFDEVFNFDEVRKSFYSLFPGNWDLKIADLGDLKSGASVEDTHFVLKSLVEELVKQEIIPVILGGSQDLAYAQYRAYDNLDQMVNLVNVDSRFDLGDAEKPITNKSYIGKIVVTPPYNLFNFSNIGYQSYFNSQDEIDLMEKLYFDSYRLGEVIAKIAIVEPVMRNADIVNIDLGAMANANLSNENILSPNGFNNREICALARYAGISEKVSSFGIYEFQDLKRNAAAGMMLAQIIWYFIEGFNFRFNENTIFEKNEFIKYQVPVEDKVLTFYKSPKSGRWWIKMPFVIPLDNKLKRHSLLPCTEDDYLDACNQIVPERWFKAKRKNEIL